MPPGPLLPHLRFRWAPKFEDALPTAAKLLITHYTQMCEQAPFQLTVQSLPPSVNSLYVKRPSRTKHQQFDLDPKAKAFRDLVALTLGRRGKQWRPTGITAGVVVFQSPSWVTAEKMPRKKDIDNKLKTLFDSIGMATEVDDCLNWAIHVFKLYGHEERSAVWLFDCGDIIEASSERSVS